MSDYDDLFEDTAADDSVFADKGALDPLAEPEEVLAREDQEQQLATLLNGVHEGYIPTTVSIYGPPGTGKTLTTRRVARAFADRHDAVAVEYVNLKECRTLFSVANEIYLELTGERKGAYEGLDGVFEGIWDALAAYPEWTILILDEIDHVGQDSNYDPNEFFYRLLRGEGRLSRNIQLSTWLVSNELLEVDLRLDSRVESAMSREEVFFPPYDVNELADILMPRLRRAFDEDALPESVCNMGISMAAHRWGDARKALTLFRQAGETANERGLPVVSEPCLEANLEATDKEAITEKLLSLPPHHYFVLHAVTGWTDHRTGEIIQPMTSAQVREVYEEVIPPDTQIGERAMREIITDLETMGLIDTWIESKGSEGRRKQVETAFEPAWVQEIQGRYIEEAAGVEYRDAG